MMIIWRTIKSRLSGVDLFRYKKVFFLLLFLFAIFFPFSSARAWYDGSWTYRKTVTFTNSASTENLTNFPILVKLTASNFDFTKAQSAGQDIRFVDSDDSSLLKYEIEKWDNAGQEAIVWVKVPQVDDSDTDFIYMYYGNGAATDGQDAPNVWTNSYMAVFHFAEQSSSYLDSSSNDVDCPTVSATRSATGKFGYAPDFNGSSNRLDCDASVTLGDMSQEAWVNVDTFTTFRPLVQHAAAAETEVTNIVYGFEIDTSANLWQQWEHSAGTNITNTSTATVSASTWTHVGTNRDTTANTVTWYRNGSATGSASSYVTDPTGGSSGALYIGGRISSAMWFDGKIDELRISSVNRSASWMNASYLTMSTSYQTYGTEEENSSASLSLSSAANQVFAVNDATTTISTITITEGDTPTITATNNIRVQIPAGFNMLWDTSDTTATIGGTASGKVSGTVSYEDSGRTLVLDVTSNLATLETVTISGLSFTSFSATSASDNLDLIVGGSGGSVVDADDKTLIVASPTMVSAANQTFEVGAGTTTISTITLTESATSATITATNNIRIQIPSGFNMVWDTSDTTATIGGTASGKVSTTVSYEDSGRTLVLDVTSNLATSETVTVAGLSFVSFSGASSADNLDLIIRGASSNVVISDTRTITIAVPTITVASSVSQPSGVANATTDNVLGVASVVRNMGTGSVTSVTIAESGTITANTELENIELWLSSDSSWSAGDNQLGSTGSFDGANGSVTFTETWALSTSTQYLIIRGDVTAGATLGDTIEISVSTMATTDTLSGTPLAIAGTTTIASDWWDDDWLYRRKLTIDNAGRTEHTTFPVMVKLTSSNFDFAKALSTGADLRFIDADGVTALSYEIEYYSTGSSTAYIWVKVPTITADSTTDYIHMYYGNSVASAGASPEDVWSNGYAAVYHFAEQSGQYLDSTSNSNDSNNVDLDYAVDSSRNNTSATGIGYFPKFNSNGTAGVPSTEGDHVAVPDANSMDFGTSSFALMARAKTPDDTFDSDLFRKGSTGIAENAWWKIEWGDQAVDNRLQYLIRVGGVDYSISYVLAPGANWRHIVGLRDVSGSPTIKLYIDGALISSVAASSGSVSNSANTGIGSKDTYNDDFFDGNLDEVRFSNVTRSADWIAAEYESLENTLLTFGSESGVPDTTAPTITNVSSDKTNATYTTGEVIDIDVTFSEAVTSTGNVTVTLETGTTDQTCTFTVSASTTGTCNYTVVSGDTSADLTVSTISGTIADASSNAMSNFVPTTNLAANKALVVDTTAVIESVSSGRSGGGRRSISETSPSESVISPVTDTNTSILDAIIPDFFKKKPEIATSVTPSQEKSLSLENSWNYLNPSFVKNFILAPLPSELAVFIQKYPDLGRVFNKLNITTVADIDRLEGTSILLPKLANLKDLPTEIVIAGGGAGKVEVASTITLDENGKVEQKIQTTSNTSLVLAVKPSTPVDSINGYLLFKKSAQKSVVELPFNSQVASAMLAFEKNDNKTPAIPSRELLVQTFAYEDSNHDGIYTADIKTPAVEGTYEVVTIINYTDKNLGSKELRLVTVIDPEGYVYYLNANGDESRISKAVVSIFNASDDTLWDAVSYNQTNPQTTDASGKYSFLVPEGKYYITALKGGHRSYTSDVFEVKSGVGIHFNIELKNSGWLSVLDWKTAFFLLIILIISSTFIGYAVHEHALKRKLMRRN